MTTPPNKALAVKTFLEENTIAANYLDDIVIVSSEDIPLFFEYIKVVPRKSLVMVL